MRERPAVSDQPLVKSYVVLIRIVDRRLGACGKLQDPLLPLLDLVLEASLGHRQRGLALGFRLGLDQVGEAFRFGQIDPAIVEGTPGELAWPCKAKTLDAVQCSEHCIHHRSPAMALKFNAILARRTRGTIETKDERIVQNPAILTSKGP